MQIKPPELPVPVPPSARPDTDVIRETAIRLEATFLAEMLKSAGLGQSRSNFGGGAGEDQFASLLVREQADQLARAGGVGLAESFFQALTEAYQDG